MLGRLSVQHTDRSTHTHTHTKWIINNEWNTTHRLSMWFACSASAAAWFGINNHTGCFTFQFRNRVKLLQDISVLIVTRDKRSTSLLSVFMYIFLSLSIKHISVLSTYWSPDGYKRAMVCRCISIGFDVKIPEIITTVISLSFTLVKHVWSDTGSPPISVGHRSTASISKRTSHSCVGFPAEQEAAWHRWSQEGALGGGRTQLWLEHSILVLFITHSHGGKWVKMWARVQRSKRYRKWRLYSLHVVVNIKQVRGDPPKVRWMRSYGPTATAQGEEGHLARAHTLTYIYEQTHTLADI